MKYDPMEYRRFERDPVGCFEAEMTTTGWAKTRFDHDLQEHLFSEEVSEFVRLMYNFFKECDGWAKLDRFARKHGTEIEGEDYNTVLAFNYAGDLLDYIFKIDRTHLNVFPYRKRRGH